MRLLQIAQLVIAFLLMISILLQNRGTGLSGVFGGLGGIYRTKRGVERTLFIATIILSFLFFASAFANVIIVR